MTPLLRPFGSSEVHLESLSLEQGYLQTSPEYAMKCLLAESGQSLYQICPAFRGGETGERHRVEFQMLEWYRVGYLLPELMQDLEALLGRAHAALAREHPVIPIQLPATRVTYKSLFQDRYGLCPHSAQEDELRRLCHKASVAHLGENAQRADLLDALFSLGVEPELHETTIVHDFPACQAALAEVREDEDGCEVANRFELYQAGMEIANAYQELTDPEELRRRFKRNNAVRQAEGRPEIPDDLELLEAMGKMPVCSGIALGIDRLLMVLLGASNIDAV